MQRVRRGHIQAGGDKGEAAEGGGNSHAAGRSAARARWPLQQLATHISRPRLVADALAPGAEAIEAAVDRGSATGGGGCFGQRGQQVEEQELHRRHGQWGWLAAAGPQGGPPIPAGQGCFLTEPPRETTAESDPLLSLWP